MLKITDIWSIYIVFVLKVTDISYFVIVATMFLEFWKRKQAEIAYEWDLFGFEDEEVRDCTVSRVF